MSSESYINYISFLPFFCLHYLSSIIPFKLIIPFQFMLQITSVNKVIMLSSYFVNHSILSITSEHIVILFTDKLKGLKSEVFVQAMCLLS